MSRSPRPPWAFITWAVFVIYGSLLPFQFQPLTPDAAWAAFLRMPFLRLGIESRADWVANGVLYVPMAFLAARAAMARGWTAAPAALSAATVCAVIAVGVEYLQLYFPPRTVSLNDVWAEGIGSAVGAVAAAVLARWVDRLAEAWRVGGLRFAPRLLELYAVGYGLLCLFPYDFLVSADEVGARWRAVSGSIWFAAQERGAAVAVLLAAVEIALVVPLGYWLARRRMSGTSSPRAWSPFAALGAGAALGLLIETAQFFVASGVSQLGSVPTRALGVCAGAALAPWLHAVGWPGLRDLFARWASVLWAAYLPVLALAVGAFRNPWQGWDAAWAAAGGVRLLPFYYHYYTTEALAVFSLGSVALMMAPVAVLGWGGRWTGRRTVVTAAVLAAAVECGKLFVAGLRPDPTNVLIAVATVALVSFLLDLARRPRAASAADGAGGQARTGDVGGVRKGGAAGNAAPSASARAGVAGARSATRLGYAICWWVLAAAALWTLRFPVAPLAVLTVGVVCAALVWRRPAWTLALLPAAWPVFDLAPWSGRFYWDEFDTLSAVCIAIALHRTPVVSRPAPAQAAHVAHVAHAARGFRATDGPRRWQPGVFAFGLLGLSLLLSTLRAVWPLPWPDENSFNNYHSVYNALRIVKGVAWAWLLVVLWSRLDRADADADADASGGTRSGDNTKTKTNADADAGSVSVSVSASAYQRLRLGATPLHRLFGTGMVCGLVLTVLAMLWERSLFTDLWNFSADVRVTGPISAMHKGGAYIECWLAVAGAFALAAALGAGRAVVRAGALVLLAATAYAVMVTYSRNGWAAFAAVVLIGIVCLRTGVASEPGRRSRARTQAVWAAFAVVVSVAFALPVFFGQQASRRLAQTAQDFDVRRAHWADGLALRDGSALTAAIGMGIGRFPDAHYWRSAEPVRAASYRLHRDGDGDGDGQPYLRLGAGATLYIEQILPRTPTRSLRLALDIRAAPGTLPSIDAAVCEKWTLTSLRCAGGKAISTRGADTGTAAPRSAAPPSTPGPPAWARAELTLDAAALQDAVGPWSAPWRLALLTPKSGAVDVARVSLTDSDGRSLLDNGDFSRGLDRWFFTTDVDPPWHLHSLPVAVLFDQGWLGVVAWTAVLATALLRGAALAWRGRAAVPAALPALVGFGVSASVNTLIDAPRLLGLLLLLAWLAQLERRRGSAFGTVAGTAIGPAIPKATGPVTGAVTSAL